MNAPKTVRPFPFDALGRVTRAQVEAGRMLLAHLPLKAGAMWGDVQTALGGRVEIALADVYTIAARQLTQHLFGVTFRIEAAGARAALVSLDKALAVKLARRLLTMEESDEVALPRPLTLGEEGALEFILTALVAPLRVSGAAKESEIDRLSSSSGWLYVLEARVRSPLGEGSVRLIAPEELRLQAPRPRAGGPISRLGDAVVSLRLEAARTQLGRSELAALQAGDVVLLGRSPGDHVRLSVGRGGFDGRLDGGRLTIESGFSIRMGGIMSEETAGDSLLGELPVELTCELGRVTMNGRELLELQPGAIIAVGRPLAGPVDLTVGGRVVARGELVDVEGEMGVRITQMCD